MGYDVHRLPPHPALPPVLSRHADLLFFDDGQSLVTERGYWEANRELWETLPLPCQKFLQERLILSEQGVGETYPSDCYFNLLSAGGRVFGHKSAYACQCPGFVPVRQGYARCSSALVGAGVITADRGIARALTKVGIPCLVIAPGHVRLPDYNCGFIGGASFSLSPALTAFAGNLDGHPDADAMRAFAAKQGVTLLSLSREPLTDVGGGLLLSPQPSFFPSPQEDI